MRITIADGPASKSKTSKKRATRRAKASGILSISCSLPKVSRGKAAPSQQRATLELGDQPELTATILDAMGTALLNRGASKLGATLIQQAYTIREKSFGSTHPLTALSLNSVARVHREDGEYKAAQDAVARALAISEKAFGPQSLPVVTGLHEQGATLLKQGRYADAEASADRGLAILDTLGIRTTDANTTRLLDVRGRAEAALGRKDPQNNPKSDTTYAELLALDERQLGTKKHPKYATHMANSGLARAALGDFGAAKAAFQKAIDLYEGMGLLFHPNLIDCYANLGSLLRIPGTSAADLKRAGDLLEKALTRGIELRGGDHVLVGNDLANRGRWLYATGNKKKAVADFSKALSIYDKNVASGDLPAVHFFIAEALTWQGRTLVELGGAADAAAAETALRKALTAWPPDVNSSKLGTAIAQVCLGRAIYLQRPRDAEACQQLCAGFRIVAKGLPDPAFNQVIDGWRTQQGCSC